MGLPESDLFDDNFALEASLIESFYWSVNLHRLPRHVIDFHWLGLDLEGIEEILLDLLLLLTAEVFLVALLVLFELAAKLLN